MAVRRTGYYGLLAIFLGCMGCPGGAQTLARIRQTQTLRCAVDTAPPEYSVEDAHGPRVTFDLEFCHAVAVAIAGRSAHVVPVLLEDETSALTALREGKADLVATASLNLPNLTDPTLSMGPGVLLDAVALLTPVTTVAPGQLNGGKVCVFSGTETETRLPGLLRRLGVMATVYPFSEEGEMQAAFTSGNCAAIAGDLTRLAPTLADIGPRFHLLALLAAGWPLAPDTLAPTMRAADTDLQHVVTATLAVLLQSASVGVTQGNVGHLPAALQADPALPRLLNRTHELLPALLPRDWPEAVISTTGNYGELYSRTLGQSLPSTLLPMPDTIPLR